MVFKGPMDFGKMDGHEQVRDNCDKGKDKINNSRGFPGVPVIKNPPANSRNTDSSRGPGRSHRPQSN